MALGSIETALDVYQKHDFSRGFQFRLLSIDGAPDYVARELIERPLGEGGYVYLRSASIPGREITDVPIEYHGFQFHAPGAVQYTPNPWTLEFDTPSDYLVRNALERWHFELFSEETSCGNFQIPCASTTIDIGLISNCRFVRQYRLIGVYPQSIGEVSYDISSTDKTSFSVAFHYQWWRLVPVDRGNLLVNDGSLSQDIDSVYSEYEASVLEGSGQECDKGIFDGV